jgi:hypothetical protein
MATTADALRNLGRVSYTATVIITGLCGARVTAATLIRSPNRTCTLRLGFNGAAAAAAMRDPGTIANKSSVRSTTTAQTTLDIVTKDILRVSSPIGVRVTTHETESSAPKVDALPPGSTNAVSVSSGVRRERHTHGARHLNAISLILTIASPRGLSAPR